MDISRPLSRATTVSSQRPPTRGSTWTVSRGTSTWPGPYVVVVVRIPIPLGRQRQHLHAPRRHAELGAPAARNAFEDRLDLVDHRERHVGHRLTPRISGPSRPFTTVSSLRTRNSSVHGIRRATR